MAKAVQCKLWPHCLGGNCGNILSSEKCYTHKIPFHNIQCKAYLKLECHKVQQIITQTKTEKYVLYMKVWYGMKYAQILFLMRFC